MRKFIENIMKNLDDRKKVVLIVILITTILCGLRVYIGIQKKYYHMDEMYSYGLMNYDKSSITDSKDFLNTWHTKDYYLDYLVVNDDEVLDFSPVYENQKNDVHPPLYYLCLRLFSTFSINQFSKWTGLLLNMVIFVISNYFVYKISIQLFKHPVYAIFACIINGSSIVALDSFLYIRMYEFSNLFILMISYFSMKIWRKKNLKFLDLLPISITLILGGLTHYFFFIYSFILYLLYSIKCLRRREFANLGKYQLCIIISAIIYLIIFPYAINHILFKNNSFYGTQDIKLLPRIGTYLSIIGKKFYNNSFWLFVVIISVICYNKRVRKLKRNSKSFLLIFPIIAYIIAVVYKSPYLEERYIMPIYSVLLVLTLYILKNFLLQHLSNKESIFLIILLVTIFIYNAVICFSTLEFTYYQYEDITKFVEERELPIVYLFDYQYNRFLDDLYLFTLTDRSIVVDCHDNFDVFKDVVNQEKHFILICNGGVNENELKNTFVGNYEYIKRLNACNVYEVTFNK